MSGGSYDYVFRHFDDTEARVGTVIIMPSNNTGKRMREISAAYPGCIGHLFSPAGWRKPWLSYSLDNGAFSAWASGVPWTESAFLAMIERCQEHERKGGAAPLWLLVPDVVADKEATKKLWLEWAPRLRATVEWPLAFAVQDGMNEHDVPADADVVFVGGSTKWKWASVNLWGYLFPRMHVGRVNSYRLLWRSLEAGAESCDGTGWFRGDRRQLAGLEQFLAEWTRGHRRHPQCVLVGE